MGIFNLPIKMVSANEQEIQNDIGVPKKDLSTGGVGQLVRASSLYATVAGSAPGQGTDKIQPMNAHM